MLDPSKMIEKARESSERIAKIQAISTLVSGWLASGQINLSQNNDIIVDNAMEIYESIADKV